MKKLRPIDWIPTVLFSLAMFGGGLGDLVRAEPLMESMRQLGYPSYLATLLGTWKVLGAAALFAPTKWMRLKQWAYAGFFFDLSGAMFSHLASGDGIAELTPPVVLLALGFLSWRSLPAPGNQISS